MSIKIWIPTLTFAEYLTPTTADPPARIGELQPKASEIGVMKVVSALKLGWLLKSLGIVDQMAKQSLKRTSFTQLANLTGLPAMSVPLHWTADHLSAGSNSWGLLEVRLCSSV
jgi:amidase